MSKIKIQVGETPVLLDEEIVRRAMKKLESVQEFDSLRELIDYLLLTWVKA